MSFPVKLKHRGKVLARIYRRPDGAGYRLYWRVREADGKPKTRQKEFVRYGAAKKAGEDLVSDLAKGSRVTALTPTDASDAMLALGQIHNFYVETGKRLSLLESVAAFCGAMKKLGDKPLLDAVDGYLKTIVAVKRKDLNEAVGDFIKERELKTKARDGKRPPLSPEHHYNTSRWLLEFSGTFPNTAICDLTKEQMNAYMGNHAEVGPKTRNERRGVIKMFMGWAVEHDFLAPTHRLLESSGLKHEILDDTEIECYTAEELRLLLERASRVPGSPKKDEKPEADYRGLLPILVLAGLAGLRLREAMRLTWEEVFRRPDHIEVKASKTKTRSRRLAQVTPAMAQWLEACKEKTGLVWTRSYDMFHIDFAALRQEVEVKEKRNGLRHSYISAHFAAHSDEGLTAALAGTSPAMIHQHYKGLLTRAEGEAWFAVAPQQAGNVIQLGATKG